MLTIRKFYDRAMRILRKDDGAVTVDWVVLTGLVIALTLAAGALMNDAFTAGGTSIQTKMSATP